MKNHCISYSEFHLTVKACNISTWGFYAIISELIPHYHPTQKSAASLPDSSVSFSLHCSIKYRKEHGCLLTGVLHILVMMHEDDL